MEDFVRLLVTDSHDAPGQEGEEGEENAEGRSSGKCVIL